MAVYLYQFYHSLSAFEACHEPPALAFTLQHLAACLEIGIQRRYLAPEVIQRPFEEAVGNEQVFLHIFLIQAISRLTCQDDQLAHHIGPAQVDAWVGFGIPLLLRVPDGLAQRHVGTDFIENVIQRTAQHGFDFQYLVSTVNQVIDGIDDRKPCSHIGLEEELHAPMAGYALQFGINLIIRRSRNLVRRHHRDVMPQEILIQGSDFGAGCTIHKHRVEDIHPDNLIVQYLHR